MCKRWLHTTLTDNSNLFYKNFRSITSVSLETTSFVAGGYGAVKGVMAFNRLAKIPVQTFEFANRISLRKVENLTKIIEEFLGGKSAVITNTSGDMILLNGNKKIRFDIKASHGDRPHFHLEKKNSKGKWVDAGPEHRYYFREE